MGMLTKTEKLCIAFLAGVMLMTFMFEPDSYKRYKLPTGDIVECSKMQETAVGNYYLSGCKNGSEYFIQGPVLEVVK